MWSLVAASARAKTVPCWFRKRRRLLRLLQRLLTTACLHACHCRFIDCVRGWCMRSGTLLGTREDPLDEFQKDWWLRVLRLTGVSPR